MIRMIIIALFLSAAMATAAHADACEQYRFGSQDWWNCKASQSGGAN